MKTVALCLSAAVCAITLAGADDVPKNDLKRLQGTWTMTTLVYNGTDHAAKIKLRFVIKGDLIAVEGNDAVKKEYAKVKFKPVSDVKPKAVDLVVADGIQKDLVIEGIYELKDDELKICAKVLGKDRPTEFASEDGSSIVLLTLKREP